MPFHVEVRRAMRRAWAFNLSEERLRRGVVDPWRRGIAFELGDREWEPRESTLRILEGPELSPPDLAHGQGWHHAEQSARDVTAEVLSHAAKEASGVAVLGEGPSAQRVAGALRDGLEAKIVDWTSIRAGLLRGTTPHSTQPRDLGVVVAVLVVEDGEPSPSWLFEAGLAIGALDGRAVVAQLGDNPPPPALRDLDALRLDPDDPASLQALAERLRRIVGPAP
jgi:hypothetical protein